MEAALKADEDPDRLSFLQWIRLLEEILEERVVSSRGRRNPRAVKRKMSGGNQPNSPPIQDIEQRIRIIK